jgi:hypothetical protein
MRRTTVIGLLGVVLCGAAPAWAQAPPRTDAIWARNVGSATITLDGNLNEPAWATAETWRIKYRVDSGAPGSGWKDEGGFPTTDSTNVLLRFLVKGNQLYLGATVPDKSIGGSGQFNRFDGFLMAIKDRLASGFPKPPAEYLYSWWYERESGTVSPCAAALDSAKGNPPTFKGRWAPAPMCDGTGQLVPRTVAQIDAWDAVTVVNGIANSDTLPDVGWTVEMRFNLAPMGYDVTDADGDIVEWNISVYDTDNMWKSPLGFDFGVNRTWWQCPWGNVAEQDEVRIYSKPSVTTSSGPVPVIDPELRIPNAGSLAAPTIDGQLTESIWGMAPSLDIKYGDAPTRAHYLGVGPSRSGEFQPRLTVNNPDPQPLPTVFNGGDATVKYFFKGNILYLGFDVRDQYVQYHPLFDRMDGVLVSIQDRATRDPQDHNFEGRRLLFQVSQAGTGLAPGGDGNQLPTLLGAGTAQLGLALKPGTVVDTTGVTPVGDPQVDTGYTAELAVDLTALGFPSGLGDHVAFLGIDLLDGDSFGPPGPFPISFSYATRTWWFREREEQCCPAWAYLDPTFGLVGVDEPMAPGTLFALLGNHPNPFGESTRLRFALAHSARVELEVYDLSGRVVVARSLGVFPPGNQEAPVRLGGVEAGLYLYRLRAHDPDSGARLAELSGKMMHLR